MFIDTGFSFYRLARLLARQSLLFCGLYAPMLWAQSGQQLQQPTLGPGFALYPAGSLTTTASEVISGKASIKGTYTGTDTYISFLQTDASVVSFKPNHSYRVSFQYKVLTAAPNGFKAFFNSPIAFAQGTPSNPGNIFIDNSVSPTGTATFTATLGAYTDYQILWGISGSGSISVDNIQIADGVTGEVLASEDAERTISASPTVSMTIRVKVPSNTPPNDTIWIYPGTLFPPDRQIRMSRVAGTTDSWQATISRPPRTILDYAFAHNLQGSKEAYVPVGTANGFASRRALITDGATANETVAQWLDLGKPDDISTGTLTGTVTDQGGNPLQGIWVSAGPHQTPTDTEGKFTIYGVPSGPCSITLQSENGEFVAVNVNATIAPNDTTVQDVALAAAAMSAVTFDVTIPADTPAGAVPRLYGDTYRLGMVQIPSDHPSPDTTRMIDMGPVGGNHWRYTVQLGNGTCINYLYTLGSYRLNYERDYQGNLRTRALCVDGPAALYDDVIAWKAPQQVPVSLTVHSPTGSEDALYIATDDANGAAPVKMWPTGTGQAAYTIYTDPSTTLKYHYIRNADFDTGPEIVGTDSRPPAYRSLAVGPKGATSDDTVVEWRHQMREPALSTVTSGIVDPIVRTEPFQTGIELIDYWRASWLPLVQPTLDRIRSINAQWVQIVPNWRFLSPAKEDLTTNVTPTTDPPKVDPAYNDFPRQDLIAHIRAAKASGLHVALTAQPYPNGFAGVHTNTWYDQFFQQVQSTMLYFAGVASQEGVEMLIIGNFSLDADNNNDAATRRYINAKWKQITAAIRASGYTGKLASQGGGNTGVYTRPEYDWFSDLDYLGAFWQIPIATSSTDSVQSMYQNAIVKLNSQFKPIYDRFHKPVLLTSIMFYSARSSSVQTIDLFDTRISPHYPADPSVPSDYDEQGRAYQALLRALAATPWVQGAYPFAYWYWDFDSKGYSIRGKTAENIVSQIYQQINAAVNPGDGTTPSCSGQLNLSGQAFPAVGGYGSLDVAAGADCFWTVRDTPQWILLTSPAGGKGNGSVTYQVVGNPGAGRTASFAVAGQPFAVEQSAGFVAGLAAVGSLGQVASEGTWDFSLNAVNLGPGPATARFAFADNDGNPLPLPVKFPQSSPVAVPMLASTVDRALNPNAQIVMESTGPDSAPTLIGSGQMLSDGGVNGFGIFSNPKQHWNAVVPLETRNASKYILAFDNTAPLTTGVAVANLSAQAASVPVIIRDDRGNQIGNPIISLSALGHTSFMLNDPQLGFPATNAKRGTLEFDAPNGGQISVLGLRANGPALTTLPVLANVGTNGGSITHVAYNGGWTSAFYLVNTGNAAAQFTLSFFDENGITLPVPLFLPQSGANTTTAALTQTLAAGAMLVVNTQAPDAQALVIGSAQLTTTGNISGFEIFRWTTFGQEASVPLETRTPNSFVLVFDDTNGLTTGAALANQNAAAANVTARVYDDAGTLLQTSSINLGSRGHTSFMLPDNYSVTENKRGMVEFVVSQGAKISAIGLRAKNDGTLTTIPVLTK